MDAALLPGFADEAARDHCVAGLALVDLGRRDRDQLVRLRESD